MEKKAILVVDDGEGFQEFMADAFGEAYLVLRAERIQGGHCLFQEYRDRIHFVLVDGEMPPGPPEMPTTRDLVRAIRDEGFLGTIIAISGKEELQEELLKAGCDAELTKPLRLGDLVEILTA